jgi:hypothetical protein
MDSNRMMVHIRSPDLVHSSINNVVSQFTPLLWLTVITTMIILTLLLSATWYVGIHCNHHKELISYGLHDTWIYAVGIICQQGKVLLYSYYYYCIIIFIIFSVGGGKVARVRRYL